MIDLTVTKDYKQTARVCVSWYKRGCVEDTRRMLAAGHHCSHGTSKWFPTTKNGLSQGAEHCDKHILSVVPSNPNNSRH